MLPSSDTKSSLTVHETPHGPLRIKWIIEQISSLCPEWLTFWLLPSTSYLNWQVSIVRWGSCNIIKLLEFGQQIKFKSGGRPRSVCILSMQIISRVSPNMILCWHEVLIINNNARNVRVSAMKNIKFVQSLHYYEFQRLTVKENGTNSLFIVIVMLSFEETEKVVSKKESWANSKL